MKRSILTALVAVASLALAGCGSDDGTTSGEGGSTTEASGEYSVIRVPEDQPTIQEAVNAAKEGDLVLISAGVYTEAVNVETPNVVVRGVDRNDVIIDGEFERENGIKVFSDGVAVENLTVRNHTGNGVFFTGEYSDDTSQNRILTGYRASYVTAYNNGLYGLYGFNAQGGQFDHSYGSGHPDSAFYIGQCNPCDTVLTDLVAEKNMLGYSGTNSTGVTIVNSVWRGNRAGIVPNSLHSEKLAPNRGTTIVGNLIADNNATDAPIGGGFDFAYGIGVVIGGVQNTVVERNLVTGNVSFGILVTDFPDSKDPSTGETVTFRPDNNRIAGNTLSDNGADLSIAMVNYGGSLFGNCFQDNEMGSEFPEGLQSMATCGGPDVDPGELGGALAFLKPAPPDVDWKTVAAPPAQPNMPDAATAKPVRAPKSPPKVDLAAITTPTG